MGHETPRNAATIGKAPQARYPAFKGRQKPVGCRGGAKRFREFRIPVVECLPAKRPAGTEAPTRIGTSPQTFRSSKGKTSGAFGGGTPAIRLFHGPLDAKTYLPVDSKAFWSEISSVPRVEATNHAGIELPETGKTRLAKRRRSNLEVEAAEMAVYKKKPGCWERIWSSSTKVDSCSSLTSREPGRSGGRRRCSVISINKTGFLPSMPLRYPQKGSGWDFMSACAAVTSTGWTSCCSCDTFSGISEGISFSYGTAERFTNGWRLDSLSPSTADCTSNGFLPMPRNSTQRSMSGTRTTPPSPTGRQATLINSTTAFVSPCKESEGHRNFSGPASMRQTFLGRDKSFHYLCNTQ